MQLLPDPGIPRIPESPPTRCAATAAEFPREQSPGATRPQDEDDATERGTILDPRTTTFRFGRLLRQQEFDGFPEVVWDKG